MLWRHSWLVLPFMPFVFSEVHRGFWLSVSGAYTKGTKSELQWNWSLSKAVRTLLLWLIPVMYGSRFACSFVPLTVANKGIAWERYFLVWKRPSQFVVHNWTTLLHQHQQLLPWKSDFSENTLSVFSWYSFKSLEVGFGKWCQYCATSKSTAALKSAWTVFSDVFCSLMLSSQEHLLVFSLSCGSGHKKLQASGVGCSDSCIQMRRLCLLGGVGQEMCKTALFFSRDKFTMAGKELNSFSWLRWDSLFVTDNIFLRLWP